MYLVLVPVPGTELLKPLEFFQSDENDQGDFCYVNEATFGKPLGHLRRGGGCQGNQRGD